MPLVFSSYNKMVLHYSSVCVCARVHSMHRQVQFFISAYLCLAISLLLYSLPPFLFTLSLFWPHWLAYGILVSQPGIKPLPSTPTPQWELGVLTTGAQSLQSCPTLCDLMDCSPPGSSVHGILQARILECVAMPSSRGIFPTQGPNLCLLHLLHWRWILYCWATRDAPLDHQGVRAFVLLIVFT